MKTKRKHLPVFFYSGIFIIAYCGFIYQEYATRQKAGTATIFATEAEAVMVSEIQSRQNERGTQARDSKSIDEEGLSTFSAAAETDIRQRSVPTPSAGIASSHNAINDDLPTYLNTDAPSGSMPSEGVPATGIPASGVARFNTSSSRTSTSIASEPVSLQTSRSSVASQSDRPVAVDTSGAATANPGSATAAADSGSEVDNSSSNQTTNDANNAAATGQAALSPQERWAVPGCPLELATGADEMVAQQMMESYGCRYLHYCRAVNDGSGDQYCWWGFNSTS